MQTVVCKARDPACSLVYLVCMVCLVELDKPDERNKPDEPDQPAAPVSLVSHGYPMVPIAGWFRFEMVRTPALHLFDSTTFSHGSLELLSHLDDSGHIT